MDDETRRRRHSGRFCSHCGQRTLVRRRLPFWARPVRWMLRELRLYKCDSCHKHNIALRRSL